MNKIALQVATFLGALSCFGSVNATEPRTPLVPLPSIDDFTDGDGWGVGLGLGVEYETAYEGSDEFELEIDPAGGVQWRTGDHIFFWAGEAIGWRALARDAWLFQASVGYEEGREEGDSDDGRLDGLGESETIWTSDGRQNMASRIGLGGNGEARTISFYLLPWSRYMSHSHFPPQPTSH